ncbi:MAG: hypothetical protein Q8Q48_02920 [Candidatus Staskawiczbacteria bacterium]|nr:hypothetical protein [Candidatus Staskawiczbacteria bacterium]
MESQIKNCQNCKKDFVIEPDDFAFYEKLDLPDSIDQVNDDITKQRILCPETKLSYNITKDELSFYKEHGIPLPQRHFDWRTLERYKPFSYMANLQHGACHYCKKEIEHYYDPELGFKKIACLECYQLKVA